MDKEQLKIINNLEEFLTPKRSIIQDNVLRRCLNERWFSDTLAWLMDPKGDHGFGVEFIKLFIKKVATKRTLSKNNSRGVSRLKWGKKGKGRISTSLQLSNSTTLREFYLSQGVRKKDNHGQQYCDIVLLDLDSCDNIILVVENKLFTINTKNQLATYFKTVENKFKRVKTREYVYLTLYGDNPVLYEENAVLNDHWVCLSWLTDISAILQSLASKAKQIDSKVEEFLQLLRYIQSITESSPVNPEELLDTLLSIASDCLFEELQRLVKRGTWQRTKTNRIRHTSVNTLLKLGLLPNYYVTVQGIDGSVPKYEKILIPFGAHVDQIFNLFDLAARDIYHLHFKDPPLYLNDNKKLTKTISEKRQKYKNILKFVHDNRYHLQVLLQSCKKIKAEAKSLFEQNELDNIAYFQNDALYLDVSKEGE
jgi:hypothetical protein